MVDIIHSVLNLCVEKLQHFVLLIATGGKVYILKIINVVKNIKVPLSQ